MVENPAPERLPGEYNHGILDTGTVETPWRGPLPADVLAALGAFPGLKRVELRSNALTGLPDAFFSLPAVEQIDLSSNALSGEVCRQAAAAYPRAQIDLRYQSRAERGSEHR